MLTILSYALYHEKDENECWAFLTGYEAMKPIKPSDFDALHPLAGSVNVALGRTSFVSGANSVLGSAGSSETVMSKGPNAITPPTPNPGQSRTGRRTAPRLRLSLPGQLIAVEGVHRCILLNLSRTGAQVAILHAMREGEGVILRCGAIDQFGEIVRSEFGLNALQFEEPLSDQQVIAIRHYHENFEASERRSLIETARKWVTGDAPDDSAG